jgi:hypothetical protein
MGWIAFTPGARHHHHDCLEPGDEFVLGPRIGVVYLSRRRSAVDGRTTRHAGYVQSECARNRTEDTFGRIKPTARPAPTRLRGIERVRWSFTFAAAYILVRLPKLAGIVSGFGPLLTSGAFNRIRFPSRARAPMPPPQADPTLKFFNNLLELATGARYSPALRPSAMQR